MSITGLIIGSYVVIKIFKSFLDSLSEKTDAIMEGERLTKEKVQITYVSNGFKLNESIRRYYYKVLDIQSIPIIHKGIVFEQYLKHLKHLKEDELPGDKMVFAVQDLKAAKYYLHDHYEYYFNLN